LCGIRRTSKGWSIAAASAWSDVLRVELPPLLDAVVALRGIDGERRIAAVRLGYFSTNARSIT
jgi:hypothetical protein